MIQPHRKTVWQCLTKLNIHLPYDTPIPVIYPRETKIYVHKRLIHKCSEFLFAIAKNWKQPNCQSANEWMNTLQ